MKKTAEIYDGVGSDYPPTVPGRLLLGNVPDLLSDPAHFFLKCYREYGPIFRIRMFNRIIPVLAGPEAHQFMSNERGEYLRSREFWQGLVEEYGAKKALISTDGEIHSRLRGVMKRGFSRSSIRNRYDQIIEITDSMITKDWAVGSEVGVVKAMQRLATEQLGIMVAGKAPGEYVDPMRTFVRDLLNTKVTRTRPAFLLYRPSFRRAKAKVFQMGQEIIDRYDPTAADPESPTLMDDIMQAAAADPDLFPGPELMLAALSPYIAGLDTVANTMSAMLYAVLKHRVVYEAVRSEVDQHYAAGPITESTLRNMPALYGLVMETLRMYPIAILAMRYTNKAFSYSGYQVDGDSPVYMATTVTHLMPEFFPDPETFDITRYAPPRNEHRQAGAFAPFGLGPHTCLGAGMAEVQMMLTMATIINRLDLELIPPDYTLKTIVNPAPGPEYGFKVRVVGRRSP